VCWTYDVCTSRKTPGYSTSGPCEDENKRAIPDCPHRPKLVSEWVKLTDDELAALEAAGVKHYAEDA
jgi:hypothetical protein